MWGATEELLAMLTEEVALLASDRRRKDPLTVHRPWDDKPTPQPLDAPAQPDAGAGPASAGHLSMFAALSDRLQIIPDAPAGADGG